MTDNGIIKGTLSLKAMPFHKSLSINLTFFKVESIGSSMPFSDEISPEQYKDNAIIKKHTEVTKNPVLFEIVHSIGYYYIDVGITLVFEHNGKVYAQVEHFFPIKRAIEINTALDCNVNLEILWPNLPLEELYHYKTISPSTKLDL